jgi:hypothetical protein
MDSLFSRLDLTLENLLAFQDTPTADVSSVARFTSSLASISILVSKVVLGDELRFTAGVAYPRTSLVDDKWTTSLEA